MKRLRRGLVFCMTVLMMVSNLPLAGVMTAFASDVSVVSDKISQGKTGKTMNVSFTIDAKNAPESAQREKSYVYFDLSGVDIWDEDEEDRKYGYAFPFEVTSSLNDSENRKSIGSLGNGRRTASLSGKVRRDLSEGYYNVTIVVAKENGEELGRGDVRIWISKSTGTDADKDDDTKTYDFVLGEGQNTPNGVYPEVLNFSLNLRNNSTAAVYAVKAKLEMDPDSTKFPFEINEANYDKRFEKMEPNETVPMDYSFAIRKDTYSGYYPIKMKIDYSTSSTGDVLETYETSFYVHVQNKEKEDEKGDFNANDRTKARIIVDGFTTNPEKIIAGDEFELILRMKNASSSIPATNILLSFESEKVTESAVFTTESGSSSIAMDSLAAGATKEVRLRLLSKPGVEQRSYGLTIKAKFDSPEFKNADESMVIDIPIKQIARLNTSTFDIMPDAINIGDESNVMFGINNTGKVMLYNVMAKFEADSIQTTDTYVGNIKPGETGNVDCMLTGVAATTDEGIVKVTITYEDENGDVFSEAKELRLLVSEPMPEEDISAGNFEDIPMDEPSFFAKYKTIILSGGIGAVVVLGIIGTVLVKRHKKRKANQIEDMEDEIS